MNNKADTHLESLESSEFLLKAILAGDSFYWRIEKRLASRTNFRTGKEVQNLISCKRRSSFSAEMTWSDDNGIARRKEEEAG